MARYYLRIQQGQFSGVSDLGPDFSDDRAAWEELANVGSDLLVGIARKLKQDANWQIELLDEGKKAKFRLSLVAETFDK